MKKYDPFPLPGTSEWVEMDRRRIELVLKVNHTPAEVTLEEEEELDYLQSESRRVLDEVYPRPKMDPADKAYLEALERELDE